MVGPDYRRPTVDTPPAWRVSESTAQELANTAWWQQFNDPVLNDLITSALKENKDLLIAAARVEEFSGRYGFVRADLFPQVGAGAEFGRSRTTGQGANPTPVGYNLTGNSYSMALNANWELDIWGRIRRGTEAARADLVASEEGRRAVILSLVSAVAGSYVNLRDLDRQLEIARETAQSREKWYNLLKDRFEGGLISEMELSQAKSQYDDALATIPQFEKSITLQENGLSVLLGRNPGPIPRGKTIDELTLPAVPAGLPSDLLERRPDIRQAEQNLIAANARIGVAKAAYFPAISLTAFFGFASADLSNLFTGPAKIWQYSAPITAPIFTAGKIAGEVKASEAVQQQALIAYQQSIQNAFREVDDALVGQSRTREQLAAQADQVQALRNYYELAQLRYDNGYTSYIEVLDAERSLFNVELSYTQNQGVLFLELINLYKAMGGGWVDVADRLATAPADAFPCMAEIEKFCKEVPPGAGRLLECLGSHEAELSDICRQKVDKTRARLEEAKKICAPDLDKFCQGVAPGQGRLLNCLKAQMNNLTPACREQVEKYGGKASAPPAQAK
jgi:multidrug efflux system outer membrane protein